jgi:hypothetical protein
MSKTALADEPAVALSDEKIREQLELVIQDPVFRSSKRSVEFLRYVVEQTLLGFADQIKERTIGIEVFGRAPSYDTNMDHVVRTAAIELRKRLAIYYGEEQHRSELRMSLVPGSYIPHFTLPPHPTAAVTETDPALAAATLPDAVTLHPESPDIATAVASGRSVSRHVIAATVLLALLLAGFFLYPRFHRLTAQDLFWQPVLDTPGPVLLAVGYTANGPPTPNAMAPEQTPLPTLHASSTPTVPFGDTVTIARVVGILEGHGRKVTIRRENSSSFSDLREGPVVLIGAFNNEWSLRLTHQLRYTLSLDADKHLIYIKDARNPALRNWSWATNLPVAHNSGPGGPVMQDYALISRIWNSDTGHVVVVIGGLYTYGTEAAGEFLDDTQLMQVIAKQLPQDDSHKNLQIVLGTTVTDDTPGPPRVLAVSVE